MIRKLTPLKAIRRKCLDCCAGQEKEVKLCPIEDCPLHAYRTGHVPEVMPSYDDGRPEATEEEKQKWQLAGQRLMQTRAKKGERHET